MRGFLIVFLALLLAGNLQAQSPAAGNIVDVDKILSYKVIGNNISCYVDHSRKKEIDEIAGLPFKDSIKNIAPNWKRLPNSLIVSDVYFKFKLTNSADSLQSYYFSPGGLIPVFDIYTIKNSRAISFQNSKPIGENTEVLNHGYKLIEIPGKDTLEFLIKIRFVKTTVNYINPKLARVESAPQLVWSNVNIVDVLGIITFVVSGFFMMMIFYSLASYRQAYRPEFLYYGGYTFCVMILLFLKAVLVQSSTWFNFVFEGYLDFFIQLTSVFLYLLFIRSYLNTKVNYPFIEKVLLISQWVVIAATLLYTYVYFGTDNFLLQNNLELYTKLYLLVLGITFITVGFRYKDKLLKYLVYGNINLIFFGLISLFFIVTPFRFKNVHWVFNNSLLYYDISVLGECILFLIGLSYKNRIQLIEKVQMQEAMKREQERQEMEKQIAIINTQQEERNRISTDMHDELGAGMTAIRLMSEMAKAKTADKPIPEIDKISDSANDLLNKMNAIIWSMISSNDTLPNLVSYIRSYALSYFETLDMKCKVDIADDVPELELSGEKRRNIFLTVKEALNNVVKHAKAGEVQLHFSFEKNICIKIIDNGIGINEEKIREFGNGLKNMRKRMERIGGTFTVTNNNGTHIRMCIPFDN